MVLCSFLTLGVLPWHGKPLDLSQHVTQPCQGSRDRCRMIEARAKGKCSKGESKPGIIVALLPVDHVKFPRETSCISALML